MIEIKKIKQRYFQFLVKSKTSKPLFKSISFSKLPEIESTLHQLKEDSNLLRNFERKTNFEGKFLFNLKNNAGKIIGNSTLYDSEVGMENGIKNLKQILKHNIIKKDL